MECCLPAQAGNFGKKTAFLIPFFPVCNRQASFSDVVVTTLVVQLSQETTKVVTTNKIANVPYYIELLLLSRPKNYAVTLPDLIIHLPHLSTTLKTILQRLSSHKDALCPAHRSSIYPYPL